MVYITASDKTEAEKIALTLLEERLVACVNIVDGVQSYYWWQGAITADSELLLLAKTTTSLVEMLIERVKTLHSYQTPCITVFPIIAGNAEYLRWIEQSVRQPDPAYRDTNVSS